MAKTDLDVMLDHLDSVNDVASEFLKGQNPSEISKTLGLPRVQVVRLMDEWKGMIGDNAAIRSRAKEALAAADQHFSKLTGVLYEVIDSADASNSGSLSQKTNAVKAIVDIEAKRISMLQSSGMLDNKELADQLIETEKRQETLEKILKEVISDCKVCKPKVMQRLAKDRQDEEAVVVDFNLPNYNA